MKRQLKKDGLITSVSILETATRSADATSAGR